MRSRTGWDLRNDWWFLPNKVSTFSGMSLCFSLAPLELFALVCDRVSFFNIAVFSTTPPSTRKVCLMEPVLWDYLLQLNFGSTSSGKGLVCLSEACVLGSALCCFKASKNIRVSRSGSRSLVVGARRNVLSL